jgi:hypothetical protein
MGSYALLLHAGMVAAVLLVAMLWVLAWALEHDGDE